MKRHSKQNATILTAILVIGIALMAIYSTTVQTNKSEPVDLEVAKRIYADKIKELKGLFVEKAVIKPPEVVECTLSRGTRSTCFSITLDITPGDFTPGPWCPHHIEDSEEKVGIWLKDDRIYEVDGEFIKKLASFYDDPLWQMFDPDTGDVYHTKTREECAAAARPDVHREGVRQRGAPQRHLVVRVGVGEDHLGRLARPVAAVER